VTLPFPLLSSVLSAVPQVQFQISLLFTLIGRRNKQYHDSPAQPLFLDMCVQVHFQMRGAGEIVLDFMNIKSIWHVLIHNLEIKQP
jgi:hypothetical protein